MTVTLYLRVRTDERKAYEERGWKWVRDLWTMGERKECIVTKNVTG